MKPDSSTFRDLFCDFVYDHVIYVRVYFTISLVHQNFLIRLFPLFFGASVNMSTEDKASDSILDQFSSWSREYGFPIFRPRFPRSVFNLVLVEVSRKSEHRAHGRF